MSEHEDDMNVRNEVYISKFEEGLVVNLISIYQISATMLNGSDNDTYCKIRNIGDEEMNSKIHPVKNILSTRKGVLANIGCADLTKKWDDLCHVIQIMQHLQ